MGSITLDHVNKSFGGHAVIPDTRLTSSTQLATGALPGVDSDPFQQLATTWAGKADDALGQVRAIASYLKSNGHYTDGEGSCSSYYG